MSDLPPARAVRRAPLGAAPLGRVTLAHDERHLRRRRLVTAAGEGFLVDLPAATRVEDGDAFELGDGRLVAVAAAEEPLIEARADEGAGLARLAWHVGNRHSPCQIEAGRLLIPRDPVLREMLRGLGARVRDVVEPFRPEGGAYAAGPAAHGHDHVHAPGDDHGHRA